MNYIPHIKQVLNLDWAKSIQWCIFFSEHDLKSTFYPDTDAFLRSQEIPGWDIVFIS